MPVAGTLRAAWFVPGNLFSVNAVTAGGRPGLFAKNERVVCVFEDGPRAFAMVLVGALFVGSIATVCMVMSHRAAPHERVDLPIDTTRSPLRLSKGAEMGRFNMGSTVILLTPADMLNWLPKFAPGSRVEVGQMLARAAVSGRKHSGTSASASSSASAISWRRPPHARCLSNAPSSWRGRGVFSRTAA